MFVFPDYITEVFETLENNGFEAYAVGGCVRDFLMDTPPHDFDLATNALPFQTIECFKNYHVIRTGEKHGTIAVIINGNMVEITTYRIDGEYKDSRRPEAVSFSSELYEDLKRRDFTINSMAMDRNGNITDLFGGTDDLKAGILRTVGNAGKRFYEDALRIMRCLRFASQLGFDIDEETSCQLYSCAELLKNISSERIRDEFLKLLCGKNAEQILRKHSGIIEIFIPEIKKMYGFDQHTPYHKFDVWEHTLRAIGNSEADPIIRMTMLLHDIAKPDCMTTDENGTGHFKAHAKLGAEKAAVILRRLKFGSSEIKKITSIIAAHRNSYKNRADVKRMIDRIGEENFFILLKVKRADDRSKGWQDIESEARLEHAEKAAVEIIRNKECCHISQLEIDGNDLKSLGFEGRQIGDALRKIFEEVISERIENTHEAIINYILSTNFCK
ncbi:MAG: CCA tRNA nucleotidyltransferase [Porcipelethomonas sp.]